MDDEAATPALREAVAVFDCAAALEAAVDDLQSHGFDRAELSLLAGDDTVRRTLGHLYRRTEELEDDPHVARAAWVSTASRGDAEAGLVGTPLYIGAVTAAGIVIASGGTLGAVAAAAALAGGAGGLIGAVLATWLGAHHARHLEGQLEKGGLLLWVTTRDTERETRAGEILARNGGRDVPVHTLPAT